MAGPSARSSELLVVAVVVVVPDDPAAPWAPPLHVQTTGLWLAREKSQNLEWKPESQSRLALVNFSAVDGAVALVPLWGQDSTNRYEYYM